MALTIIFLIYQRPVGNTQANHSRCNRLNNVLILKQRPKGPGTDPNNAPGHDYLQQPIDDPLIQRAGFGGGDVVTAGVIRVSFQTIACLLGMGRSLFKVS
jgi:hypothetical protein